MSDLRERTPGHGLIEKLIADWDRGAIHLTDSGDEVEVEESATSWYRGTIGERKVGAILGRLGRKWTVLHSVPFDSGNRDIDHVVIGPGGVFTINTKYHPGKTIWARGHGLTVNGHGTRYVPKACHEAQEASRRLTAATGMPVPVTAMIVVVEAAAVTPHPPIGDGVTVVKVLREKDLNSSLHSRHPLTPDQVERITALAVLPETWHDRPRASMLSGDKLALEFEALQASVAPGLEGPRAKPVTPPPARPQRPSTLRAQTSSKTSSRTSSKTSTTTTRAQMKRADALAGLVTAALIAGGALLYLHFSSATESRPAPGPTPTPAISVAATPAS